MFSILTSIRLWFSNCFSKSTKPQDNDDPSVPKEGEVCEISLKGIEDADQIDNSENNKQLMTSFKTTLVDGIKVAMATLLSIFVPQYCADTETTCTLQQNFQDLSLFNEFVIAWNFITLGMFIYTTMLQTSREAYFISHLEESHEHAYNSLTKNLRPYPRIMRRIREHNDRLYRWARITFTFFICNIVFSALLVFYYFYDGFRTVTTLLANVLLVYSKLYDMIDTLADCRHAKTMALSTLKSTPLSYNIVDDAYATDLRPSGKYQVNVKIDLQKLKKLKRQTSILNVRNNERIRSKSLPPPMSR